MDSIVRAEMAQTGVPGVQIAIVERGRIAYASAYGVADVENGRPVSSGTLFQIAGVTPLFTASLLAEMHARGAVDLDAPVRRYLPDVAGPRAGSATIRQLLSMSAGWLNTSGFFGPSEESALSAAYSRLGDSIVFTDPGRVFSYSNPSYNAAGLVAELVTKRPFADVLDSLVLRPLGLSSAAYRPSVVATREFSLPHVAPPGQPTRVQKPTPANAAAWPAGFLYASAGEVARLAIALMNEGVVDGRQALRAEGVRQVTHGVVLVPEVPADSLALGIHVARSTGRRIWDKAGGMLGWESHVTMWPDDGFAVVVNANRQTDQTTRLVEKIAARIAGLPAFPAVDVSVDREPTAEERAALAGRYGQGSPSSEYFEQDGRLMVRLGPATLPVRLSVDGTRIIVQPATGPKRVTTIVRDASGAVAFLVRDSRAYARIP